MNKKPSFLTVVLLSLFVVLITLQPCFVHGKINLFEVGLYLPGINSILHGAIPFRDFLYLRGPFELYMPAGLMLIFGKHLSVLYSYFYGGTILVFLLCLWVAKELFSTRYLLFLMTLVLVARTFPRVVFTYWGGMRYALGWIAIFFAIKFFKYEKKIWIFYAGIFTAFSLLTSVEIGVYVLAGILCGFLFSLFFRVYSSQVASKGFLLFIVGIAAVVLPYIIYLMANNAFVPYVNAVKIVTTNLIAVINPDYVPVQPNTAKEFLSAMVNPVSKNFRHLTPMYLYLFISGYLVVRMQKKQFAKEDVCIVCLTGYGLIMYLTAFRSIWAAHFEMALQPEKILLFFLLERAYFCLKEKKVILVNSLKVLKNKGVPRVRFFLKITGINFLFLSLFMSSVCYALTRYDRRFFAFQSVRNKILGKDTKHHKRFNDKDCRALTIDRARGIIVPKEQADEIEEVVSFVKRNTKESESVMMYQELGAYHFFADRPFVGRFPMPFFSWFSDEWHEEFISSLLKEKPRYIIVPQQIPKNWQEAYLTLEKNNRKFMEIMQIIDAHYRIVYKTPLSYIYGRKGIGNKN